MSNISWNKNILSYKLDIYIYILNMVKLSDWSEWTDADLAAQYAKSGMGMGWLRSRTWLWIKWLLTAAAPIAVVSTFQSCDTWIWDSIRIWEWDWFCALVLDDKLDNTDSNPNNDYSLDDFEPTWEYIWITWGVNAVNISNGYWTIDVSTLLPNNVWCEEFDIRIEIDVQQELPWDILIDATMIDPIDPTREKNTYVFKWGELVDPNDETSKVASWANIELKNLQFRVDFNWDWWWACDFARFQMRVYIDEDQGSRDDDTDRQLVWESKERIRLL
jgi:hypothetical protein